MSDIASPAPERIQTAIPGRQPIELAAFYEEFRDYYPQCELETKRWFVEHVRPDWWIFDIGANIGYYTILFAQLAPQGRVFAFEPTTTAAMLRTNLQHNDIRNAAVHEVALGAKTGAQHERIFRIWGTEGEVKDYPFYRLDDFIKQNGIERVDCLKIDVDSFDFDVLRGAEQTLLKHNPVIVIELNHALAKRNQSGTETLAWLSRRGYRKALVLDHYDNFVLQRGEAVLTAEADTTSMELLFRRPARLDEKLETTGTPVGSPFVTAAELHGGASLRAPERAQTSLPLLQRLFGSKAKPLDTSGRIAFEDVADVPVETNRDQWTYALSLHIEPSTSDEMLAIAISAEVLEGALGIGVCGDDISRFCAPERVLAAMPGQQRVVIKVRRRDARVLILRNVADDGTRTLFKVSAVEARTSGPG